MSEAIVFATADFRADKFAQDTRSSLEQGFSWRSPVLRRLRELLALERNWDSFDARPIEESNAQSALELLQQILWEGAPLPWIVPTSAGGIQIEWHSGTASVEVEVVSRNRFEVFSRDSTGQDEEFVIQFDVSPLRDRLEKLRLVK